MGAALRFLRRLTQSKSNEILTLTRSTPTANRCNQKGFRRSRRAKSVTALGNIAFVKVADAKTNMEASMSKTALLYVVFSVAM